MSETPSFRTVDISRGGAEPPGVRHVTVKSRALGRRADVTVYIPPDGDGPFPLVVLLHGVYGSHWNWTSSGRAHETAARLERQGLLPFALAMPSDGLWGDGSAYSRIGSEDFATWVRDEVPAIAAMVDSRVDVNRMCIAGLSMGGFGAVRLAAENPGLYRAAAGLSSVTDISNLEASVEEGSARYELSHRTLLSAIQEADGLPPLYMACGREDHLLPGNRALHEALLAASIPHTYEEFDGAHTWDFWTEHLADVLRFCDAEIRGRAAG